MKTLRYSLIATLCALVVPATADAALISNNSGGAITINDINDPPNPRAATPYPSTIDITGGDGPITKVAVMLNGVTHNSAGDIDIALVSPSGAASILMSDACGTNTTITNLTFIFDQSAGAPLPAAGCTTGTFQPADYAAGDNFPAPGPGTGLTANLNNFNGTSANGDWRLFVVDDSAFQAGSIASWGLQITTSTSQIVVPALGPTSGIANPYPSTKTFATANGQVIEDVNLNITGFNHEHPDDVDMLLQGPTGETVMVMSDACGDNDITSNFNYVFDDEATAQLSDTNATTCGSASKRPSDFGDPPENMPSPVPPRPYGATMSVFDGLPGGDFRLFINDDTSGDIGYINDWSLTLTTRPIAPTAFAATAVPTAEGQTAQLTVNRTGSTNLGAAAVNLAVTDVETDNRDFGHALPTTLQFARGEASKTIDIPIVADNEGEPAERFQVALSDATGDAALAQGGSIANVTIARSEPDNRFTLGQAIKKRNGSAEIPVTVPGPGQLTSDDAGAKDQLKTVSTAASAAGTIILKVKPSKSTKRKLRRGKKVKLTAKITFTPTGGSANSAETPVKLKKSA